MLIPRNPQQGLQRYRRYIPAGYTRSAVSAAGLAHGAKKMYDWYRSQGDNKKVAVKKANRNYNKKYKRKNKVIRNQKTLKKQVKELKRVAESDMGTLLYRFIATGRVIAAVNSTAYFVSKYSTTSILESVLTELRYYNPSVPGTLTQADGTTGTFNKEFLFTKAYAKTHCVNNYQTPVEVFLYVVTPRGDTSIPPDTSVTNGLTDIGNPSSSSRMVYPTDSTQFTDLWKIVKSDRCILQPGQSRSINHSIDSPFQYDPSFHDQHSFEYLQTNKNSSLLIRVQGVLGHDSVANEQGYLQGGIDFSTERVFEVKYAAGADIKYIHLNESLDTFTNIGVVSSKPVSDNISYSIA